MRYKAAVGECEPSYRPYRLPVDSRRNGNPSLGVLLYAVAVKLQPVAVVDGSDVWRQDRVWCANDRKLTLPVRYCALQYDKLCVLVESERHIAISCLAGRSCFVPVVELKDKRIRSASYGRRIVRENIVREDVFAWLCNDYAAFISASVTHNLPVVGLELVDGVVNVGQAVNGAGHMPNIAIGDDFKTITMGCRLGVQPRPRRDNRGEKNGSKPTLAEAGHGTYILNFSVFISTCMHILAITYRLLL